MDRAEQAAVAPSRRLRCVLAALAGAAGLLGASGGAVLAQPTPVAATPTITILSPQDGASYERGSHVRARFTCSENGTATTIASCAGTVASGAQIDTAFGGPRDFTVTATDTSGHTVSETVHYTVWAYVDPLRAVAGLRASRIDMGVDYSGSGPILALGRARVITADYVPGPEGCWGRTCAPAPGGWVAYRLLDGPFAGRYVYVVENIAVKVRAGEIVRAGQEIAVLHPASPNLEIGWAAGREAETLALARGHECPCGDPGGWSSVEGLNFDRLLVWLGAPSGYVTTLAPGQRMPRGWPSLPPRARGASR